MKIVVCWADISGYMAACWRELAKVEGLDIFILARHVMANGDTDFGPDLMRDVPCILLSEKEIDDVHFVQDVVVSQAPDVVLLSGWCFKAYRSLPNVEALKNCRFIMGMDTPRQYTWRQFAARFLLRNYVRRMDAVFVPGERCWQYARYLGVEERKIYRGAYGVDVKAFKHSYELRKKDNWPKRFLFVGRYAPIKGVDVLLKAYQKYREIVRDPWELTCCGKGCLADLFRNQPGITDAGFVSPLQQPELFSKHGALILPSRFDPWPLIIVEACASGLPVVCTQACGSAVELVRPLYNGVMCATNDVDSLVSKMEWIHKHHDQLSVMGRRSIDLAAPYSAEMWATRMYSILKGS